MRPGLKWALAATGIASVVSVWMEPSTGGDTSVVAARTGTTGAAPAAEPAPAWQPAASAMAAPSGGAASVPLPSELPARDLEGGQRDIFTPVMPPPPPPPPPPLPPAPPPPPPPPAPPPLTWRAVGAMVTPQGERLVWLSNGGEEQSVKPGTRLADGYVVERIDPDAVVLSYPPTGTTSRIALPRDSGAGP